MMRNIAGIKAESKEDTLRYAYAFMKSQKLNIKECSFFNPNPKQIDKEYLLPRDTYIASYDEENLPSWESFRTNLLHNTSPAFACIASIDKADKKRVVCTSIGNMILFNCYGSYENEAKKVFNDILLIYESLK